MSRLSLAAACVLLVAAPASAHAGERTYASGGTTTAESPARVRVCVRTGEAFAVACGSGPLRTLRSGAGSSAEVEADAPYGRADELRLSPVFFLDGLTGGAGRGEPPAPAPRRRVVVIAPR